MITSHFIPLFTASELKGIANVFVEHIENKLHNKQSSLAAVPHPFMLPHLYDGIGKSVVIGGTYILSADWEIQERNIKLLNKKTIPTPKYLDAQLISDLLFNTDAKEIGLNIAFLMQPILRNKILDGIIIPGKREITLDERLNKHILGETLLQLRNQEKLVTSQEVAVANDSICLLLSGSILSQKPLIAGIVGTGTNIAIYKTNVYTSNQDSDVEGIALNLESGHFTNIPLTKWDHILDDQSSTKGRFLTEKQISGRYLYRLYNIIAQENNIDIIMSSEDLNNISQDTDNRAHSLARDILNRSAQLLAMKLYACCIFLGIKAGKTPILMEGSLFWKSYQYKEQVKQWMHILAPAIDVNFSSVEESSLVGAAMLARTIPKKVTA